MLLLNLCCAFGGAALLRKQVGGEGEGGEEKADLQKVFGFIGLFTLVGLWWLGKALSLLTPLSTLLYTN